MNLKVLPLALLIQMVAAMPGHADDAIGDAAHRFEQSLKARVGVMVIDTGDDRSWSWHADERFPMASTFKALACGALLAEGRSGDVVTVVKSDLVPYSPVTEKLLGKPVAAGDLCRETLRVSDNTVANKVLDVLGGPPALTAWLRTFGDGETRLDRREPDLNEGRPGDPRDTTTPDAMAGTLRKLLLGDGLPPAERQQLTDWMVADEVADALLRAGIPKDWKIADRTGTGGHGTRGIVAVMWPPQHAPVVAVIYITATDAPIADRNAAIASLGRTIAEVIGD